VGNKAACGEGGTAGGISTFEEKYQQPAMGNPYDATSPGFQAVKKVGNAGTILIHVYRAGGKPITCDNYTLTISNG
jgi:hypothetical protein